VLEDADHALHENRDDVIFPGAQLQQAQRQPLHNPAVWFHLHAIRCW
jgi:hypothetical protein